MWLVTFIAFFNHHFLVLCHWIVKLCCFISLIWLLCLNTDKLRRIIIFYDPVLSLQEQFTY